jgi:hypothetical protein
MKLLGDVTVTCFHVAPKPGFEEELEAPDGTAEWTADKVTKTIVFRYGFNTGFINTQSRGSGLVQLSRSDLDTLPPAVLPVRFRAPRRAAAALCRTRRAEPSRSRG